MKKMKIYQLKVKIQKINKNNIDINLYNDKESDKNNISEKDKNISKKNNIKLLINKIV